MSGKDEELFELSEMRDKLGMAPLSDRVVNCMRCKKRFMSQFIGERQNLFLCMMCKRHNFLESFD